jgi:hypothetical protein
MGTNCYAGNGGTFVIKENFDSTLTPLFIGGGAGGFSFDEKFANCANGSLDNYGKKSDIVKYENCEIGTSGKTSRANR